MKPIKILLAGLVFSASFCVFAGDMSAVAQSTANAKASTGDAAKKKPGPKPSLVGVDVVRQEPLSQTIPIVGRLVARQAGQVAAQVAGAVALMKVEVGDRLEKNQILVELNTDTLTAQLNMVKGELLQSHAQLDYEKSSLRLAEQGLARQQKLKKSGAFSKAQYEDWIQKVARAQASVAMREAEVSTKKASKWMQEISLDKAVIKAPYSGVVTRRMAEAGSYLRIGDPVVYMISDRALEVEAEVPSLRVAGLVAGVKVSFELDNGHRFDAVVRAVLPSENPLTRTRTVRFSPDFSGSSDRLADAQSVTVFVPVGKQRNILSVHKDAIIKRGSASLVFVVSDNKAQSRTITLGEAVGARIEVLSGLEKGDQVVVRGNERLRGGAPVKIN